MLEHSVEIGLFFGENACPGATERLDRAPPCHIYKQEIHGQNKNRERFVKGLRCHKRFQRTFWRKVEEGFIWGNREE